MSIHLVIDGYNFIGASEGQGIRDMEAERDSLVESLAAYKRLRKVKVSVIFDGTRSGRLTRGKEMRSGIEVIFSKEGETADSVIKEISSVKRGSVTVVTSDRELESYAKGRGSIVIHSGEFRELLDYAMYESLKGVRPEDEEENAREDKKGPSKRPSKAERDRINRLKKL